MRGGSGCSALCLSIALCVVAAEASAHRLAPSLLELQPQPQGRVDVHWKTPLVRAAGVEILPELPGHCRALGERTAERGADAASLRWSVNCGERGLLGSTVAVRGLEASGTGALVRVVSGEGHDIQVLLSAQRPSFVVPRRASLFSVLRDYAWLGFRHIGSGLDHLFFVWGVMLLVRSGRKLLVTLTAFTLGHSLTLSLAVLGWLDFPGAIVEVAIAASVFAIALELTRRGVRPSALARRPWTLALGFGLLHGMGFAAALAEVGLPSEEILAALLAFNLGIELGQLAWIALALAAALLLRSGGWQLPARLARLPAYAIGSTATFWMLDRVGGWF